MNDRGRCCLVLLVGAAAAGGLSASFSADAAPAGPETVSLQLGSTAGDIVTVEVAITDTTGIFGVVFDLVYDPAQASWLSAKEGDLLDNDGADTEFLVSGSSGRLVVGAARLQDGTGSVPDVEATGSEILASFRFRLLAAGASRVDFDPAQPRTVTDRDALPRPVSWSGGTLLGN